MDWQTLGQRVRTLRKTRRLTQKQLAADSGVTGQMISLMELGQTGSKVETLEAVAHALGCELVIDVRDPGAAPDPLVERIRAALPRLPRQQLRALVAQIDAFDSFADDGIE